MTDPAAGLPIRALRVALVLGALVDLSGAIPLLFFPAGTARFFGAPVHGADDFWPFYASVFLFVLPCFYLIGATDPARNIGIIIGAILGRLMGAVFYAGWFMHLLPTTRWAFAALGVMNLLFALYYAGALGIAGRAIIRARLRPAT